MKHRIAAIVLATAAGMAHGFTVDLHRYQYYLQGPNIPVLVFGPGACSATDAPKGEWFRAAALGNHPMSGEQFETPGCWNIAPTGGTYCMIDMQSNKLDRGCLKFDLKQLLKATSLPRQAF